MSREDIYRHQNFGQSSGIGARCGLVLVDFVNGFVDEDAFGGPHIAAAVERTGPLLDAFRSRELPIAHTRVVFADDGSQRNVFCMKVPSLSKLTETAAVSQIVPSLAPRPGEHVLRKTSASAFFSTGLSHWLRLRGVDTAVVVGCTTSGCIRATVIDAMQHDFRTVVIEDCVGDRAIEPHEANLFDMRQKYADVMPRDAFISLLAKG
ncbi:MAG: isochorismatase family protein [Gammaproteobacteria bacterium]|nr:isochorismatase family protein [Gammaproteobacteria bacterium]MBU1444009.1 isochorismatase family protein [Gammaproteobacteria bacterium]MBU2288449.1 isochorismatase family protein [Gammaproteobacteria bacterium]MBU2408226.1 isochorismatase family protein [Gammaproteobacteria bacterium]